MATSALPVSSETVLPDNALSVIGRALPPVPPGLPWDSVSLLLFYQYVEPLWSKTEHKKVLGSFIKFCEELGVTGRGRCAREGLNCTLTGTPEQIRGICSKLRAWDALFLDTDFKITDGMKPEERFKALTIRKTEEIVAYGLPPESAPSLFRNEAKHVPADEYHRMMGEKNTVIIDVRNAYESAIGHFAPPEGGATLIDPKMRNSREFPKWLNAPETKQMLDGKRVMMYCTGGIRCERASALLTQMSQAAPDEVKPAEIVMVRGGIERYLKTYPEGGHWKGKNFLFDRRLDQQPELKTAAAMAADVESVCCVCVAPCALYRGEHQCHQAECKVPVIVCDKCQDYAALVPEMLTCPLCKEGFDELRGLAKPDLKGQLATLAARGVAAAPTRKKQRSNAAGGGNAAEGAEGGEGGESKEYAPADGRGRKRQRRAARPPAEPSTRLLVKHLPLTVTKAQLRAALGGGTHRVQHVKNGGLNTPLDGCDVRSVRWVTDRATGHFYGSASVDMATIYGAQRAVEAASAEKGVKLPGRHWGKTKDLFVAYAYPAAEGAPWPPPGYVEGDAPPPFGQGPRASAAEARKAEERKAGKEKGGRKGKGAGGGDDAAKRGPVHVHFGTAAEQNARKVDAAAAAVAAAERGVADKGAASKGAMNTGAMNAGAMNMGAAAAAAVEPTAPARAAAPVSRPLTFNERVKAAKAAKAALGGL
jgi:predicted sulfurtransferase